MSVCIKIRTEKKVSPKEIFDAFIKKGERIITTCEEFPSLKFGEIEYAARGIEINEEDYGYEVRICVGSNQSDYELFCSAIEVMAALTGGAVFVDEDEEIHDVSAVFNTQWIDRQMEHDCRLLYTLFRPSGEAIILQGMFSPLCLGYQLLCSEGIDVWKPDLEKYKQLTRYFGIMQESIRDCKHALQNLAVHNEESGEDVGLTALHISNHKLSPFDFVPYNPLLAIIDEDYGQEIIIPFKKFRHLIRRRGLHLFDDYQCGKCLSDLYHRKEDDPIEVNDVRDMLKEGRRYVVKDIFQKPLYPGKGFDKKQRTYILMWNPDGKDPGMTEEEYRESIVDIWPDKGDLIWDVSDCSTMRMGDRFFIVRNGQEKNGIVMSGVFGSGAYLYTYERRTLWAELDFNFAVDCDKHAIITTEQLKEAIPDLDWSRTFGCYKLKNDQAKKMEELFAPYFNEMLEKIDGKTVNATHYMP
ncbi:MAG: hypothetical protein ACI3YC_01680 [Alloprevotella sp.]